MWRPTSWRALGRGLPETPWFEGDHLEQHLARSRFDAETEAFVRQMALSGAATIDLGDAVRTLCDQAVEETEFYFEGRIGRVQDAWHRSHAVKRLAANGRIRRLLIAAFGRRPFPFQTLNFKRGSQQALHADTIHFHSLPERFMCGVWIALEDVAPGSGAVVYHPGSHRLPTLSMQDAGVNGSHPEPDDYKRHWVPAFARQIKASGLPEAHAVIRKGSAFVWAANLAHGGSRIQDPASTRRSLVTHYFFEDCIYFTPMFSDVAAGQLHYRLPADIRTGRPQWPRRDGRRVPLSEGLIQHAATERRERQPKAV